MPGSPRQTSFCSWKGTKISAERDVDSHVSRLKLEKALKSVLREMPIGTFLFGNLKYSGWTVIGPWTAIGEWTATANRSSGLLLRHMTVRYSGPRPYNAGSVRNYRSPGRHWRLTFRVGDHQLATWSPKKKKRKKNRAVANLSQRRRADQIGSEHSFFHSSASAASVWSRTKHGSRNSYMHTCHA